MSLASGGELSGASSLKSLSTDTSLCHVQMLSFGLGAWIGACLPFHVPVVSVPCLQKWHLLQACGLPPSWGSVTWSPARMPGSPIGSSLCLGSLFSSPSGEYGVLSQEAHKGVEGLQEEEHPTERIREGTFPALCGEPGDSRSWARKIPLR